MLLTDKIKELLQRNTMQEKLGMIYMKMRKVAAMRKLTDDFYNILILNDDEAAL